MHSKTCQDARSCTHLMERGGHHPPVHWRSVRVQARAVSGYEMAYGDTLSGWLERQRCWQPPTCHGEQARTGSSQQGCACMGAFSDNVAAPSCQRTAVESCKL